MNGADGGRPIRSAATLVLVRPGPAGPEVLLTRRPDTMGFGPGFHVFPGGAIEETDADPELIARARGSRDDPEFEVAGRLAAIRETWEEVGILLAASRDGKGASEAGAAPLSVGAAMTGDATDGSFLAMCRRLDAELSTDGLVELGRWTTPPTGFPWRFRTRIFAAELPPRAIVRPHPGEVAEVCWLRPREALARMALGELRFLPPTSATLQLLERATGFADIRAALGVLPSAPIAVRRLGPGLAIVTGGSAFGPGGLPANTILVGRREVVVIDPGDQDEAFLDRIEAEVDRVGGRIVAIALTHVDPGHAAGALGLADRVGVQVHAGPGAAAAVPWPLVEIGPERSVPGTGGIIGGGTTRGMTGGGSAGASIEVIPTPGHRPDHLAFLLPGGVLAAGDAFGHQPALVLPPEGDPDAQRRSLADLAAMVASGRVTMAIPGHGEPFTGSAAIQTVIDRETARWAGG